MWTGAAIEVERFLMNDMDHRVIGGRLAESWGIDTELQQVITHHHDVGDKAPGLLKLIRRHGGQLPLPLSCRGHSAPLPPVLHAHRQSGEEVHQAWRRRSSRPSEEIFEDLVEVISRVPPAAHLSELVDL